MSTKQLLKLIIDESVVGEQHFQLLYQDIVQFLWQQQFPGATVIRALNGIDNQGNFRFFFYEDVQFNHLPVIIETVHEKDAIQAVLPILKNKMGHGEIVLSNVQFPLKEATQLANQQQIMLKIYIQEEAHWFKQPLYQKILSLFQQHGFIWSTITKGIEGFGQEHVIHKQKMFSFSEHTPVVIEAIGESDAIQKILPELQIMVKDGLVISMPVQVYMNQ